MDVRSSPFFFLFEMERAIKVFCKTFGQGRCLGGKTVGPIVKIERVQCALGCISIQDFLLYSDTFLLGIETGINSNVMLRDQRGSCQKEQKIK